MGGDFHASLKGEKLILTNYHNVSDPVWTNKADPRVRSKLPQDVIVSFELLSDDPDREWEVPDIIWQSPPDQYDATPLATKGPSSR